GVDAPAFAAQPLAVVQMRTGELDTHAGTGQPLDRLPIQALGLVALAQQSPRARLDPERPVAATRAGNLGEPLERIGRELGLATAGGRHDQLDQTPVVE